MATLSIFEYKGIVGGNTDMINGKFRNDVKQPGQMGCVVSAEDTIVSPAALALLRKSKREGGSFAQFMLTACSDGTNDVCVLGFNKHMITDDISNKIIKIGRECDLSVLDHVIVQDIEAPEDFKEYVESLGGV